MFFATIIPEKTGWYFARWVDKFNDPIEIVHLHVHKRYRKDEPYFRYTVSVYGSDEIHYHNDFLWGDEIVPPE